MKAIYTYNTNSYCIRIPNKKGNGYLKSAFGWHHFNDASQLLDQLMPNFYDIQIGYTDIDGYMSIPIKTDADINKANKQALILNDIIQQIFPRIDGFILQDWNTFFNSL